MSICLPKQATQACAVILVPSFLLVFVEDNCLDIALVLESTQHLSLALSWQLPLFLPLLLLLSTLGTLSNEKATQTMTAKNNSKHNNCTLECTELGACTWLLLKLELENNFSRVVGTTRTYQQNLSQYLFSFMEKHLIVFLFTKFKAKKQNPNDLHKEVDSKPEMRFFRVYYLCSCCCCCCFHFST